MAKETHFTWMDETTSTRSYGGQAYTILRTGESYPVKDFPAEVVAEWVKTGHAKYAKAVHEE